MDKNNSLQQTLVNLEKQAVEITLTVLASFQTSFLYRSIMMSYIKQNKNN